MEAKQIKFRLKDAKDFERYRWAMYCHGFTTDQESGIDMLRVWFEATEKEYGPPVRPNAKSEDGRTPKIVGVATKRH